VVRVRVPATSANLGPGFDALGVALDLHEEVQLTRLGPGPARPQVTVYGAGAGRVPHDENLLAFRAAAATYHRLGRPVPALEVHLETRIPKSGGLGGTGAAIVGGIVAANALEGEPLTQRAVLELAMEVEGHPDNVAPALLGGLVICVQGRAGLIAKRLEPPGELRAVLCIPEQAVPTKSAREVLPRQVSREDAIFNLSRTALLVAAFQTRDWALLREAMDDRLHQPARSRILPVLFPVVAAAIEAGAHGGALSGSGAALIAFATHRPDEVAEAMRRASGAQGYPSRTMVLKLSPAGATVMG
jgi:homoserine kinase